MVSLVRSYADGRTDDEAFEAAIGMDVAAFNDAWLADLGAKPPVRYGPQPAPAGPIPDGWDAASPAPGSVATLRPRASTDPPVVSRTVPLDGVSLGPIGLWLLTILVGGGVVLLVWSRTRGRSA